MLCPDSRDAHYVWKDELFPKQTSVVPGKTYEQIVDMHVTPFVLPYHLHSFQMTQVLPYLTDLCTADSTQCYQDAYSELCYKNLDWIVKANDVSEDSFEQEWSKTVSDAFKLPQADILALWGKNDTHNSNWRVRENWKYGASVGLSGTPQAFVNGVKLDTYPGSAQDWEDVFAEIFQAGNQKFLTS